MRTAFDYKHPHYFWVAAKAGSMSRAVEKLAIAVQPVSTKVRELACALRCTWLKPAGCGLLPTNAKVTAMPDSLENLAQRLRNPCGKGR